MQRVNFVEHVPGGFTVVRCAVWSMDLLLALPLSRYPLRRDPSQGLWSVGSHCPQQRAPHRFIETCVCPVAVARLSGDLIYTGP